MSEFNKEYKNIVSEIESAITNEKEKKIVKQKVEELTTLFVNKIEYINNSMAERIKAVEENQKRLNIIVKQLETSVNDIESDIYDEDESSDYDFEIVCPYCNSEFIADMSLVDDDKNEIRCPDCNNIIELDWNDEEDSGCSGNCGGCHGCGSNDDDM